MKECTVDKIKEAAAESLNFFINLPPKYYNYQIICEHIILLKLCGVYHYFALNITFLLRFFSQRSSWNGNIFYGIHWESFPYIF